MTYVISFLCPGKPGCFYSSSSLNNNLTDVSDDLSAFTFTAIPTNTNLNDLQKAGFYGCASGAIAQTLVNCPITSNFFMIVADKAQNYQGQMIITGSTIFSRTESSSGWGDWYQFTGTKVS